MLEAVVGAIENSLAFAPDKATLVMFNGCAFAPLLITIDVCVCLGNPTVVMLAVPGVAQVPPAGVVTEGCGGTTHVFGPGG